jgi:purine-nucleoside phosphorylase
MNPAARVRDELEADAARLSRRIGAEPAVGLVLGSGLGDLADEMEDAVRVPYEDLRGFARPTVEGHAGVLVAGTFEGMRCIALQGRFHLYEGHDADAVAYPVRLLVRHGLRVLIVTNAAGAVNPAFVTGDLVILDDHINLLWRNPLLGPVHAGETRFPDMSEPYDRELQSSAERIALEQGVRMRRGVYCAVLGPSYETSAEVRMLRRLGADVVGMSTVPEVLVARAAGVPVLGITLVTNAAADQRAAPLSHDEVIEAGREARARFGRLVRGIVHTFAGG